jgi:hypothetical protein
LPGAHILFNPAVFAGGAALLRPLSQDQRIQIRYWSFIDQPSCPTTFPLGLETLSNAPMCPDEIPTANGGAPACIAMLDIFYFTLD